MKEGKMMEGIVGMQEEPEEPSSFITQTERGGKIYSDMTGHELPYELVMKARRKGMEYYKKKSVWVEEMLRWPEGKSELLLQCRPGLACKVITDDCVPSILHSDLCVKGSSAIHDWCIIIARTLFLSNLSSSKISLFQYTFRHCERSLLIIVSQQLLYLAIGSSELKVKY